MGKIELRDFDGDLEALFAMTRDSFREEYGDETWLDLYRPEMAQHIFADVPDPRFLVGAYDGAKLVAFIANLPRRYRFNGKTYLGVASTMLVTHRDYRGVGIYLISECLRRNQDFGADFALMILERTHTARLLFEQYLKPRHHIELLKRMYMIVHSVDVEAIVASQNLKWYVAAGTKLLGAHRPLTAPPVAGMVRHYRDTDLDEILALIGAYSDRGRLVRLFSHEALARRLDTQDITATVVYERDRAVMGFINFTVHAMVSKRGTHCWAWLDFLYWEGLSDREKKALLAGLWEASRNLGCIGILEWNRGYYAKGALFRSRFVPYPRLIEMNAWVFNQSVSLQGVDSVCEQVF
jgi:hypothetical protein